MPLGTVDRTPPSLFRQGASALSKLMVLSALAVVLMVVDARMRWAAPLRSAVAVALYPLQWLALQPVRLVTFTSHYVGSLDTAQREAAEARAELTRQAQRAALVEHLAQENREMRSLLGMRERLPAGAQGAEVLYESPDPYSRKLVINRGQTDGIQAGAPVMDGYGVLGQVTRVYTMTAEVTLLTDPRQTIPVINTRTGQRSLAIGDTKSSDALLELRFVPANTETLSGDVLTTSGVDGVYPPGLPVAKVLSVSNRGVAGFARVECAPMARMNNTMHVLVVHPQHNTPSTPQKPTP